MAGRPPKESLDYSTWDVSILDNDEKIDMLLDAQGIGAFTVYFYLCQKAYGSNGYYLEWGYSRCATIARKLGKGASADYVKQVVDMCFQCCLFDKRLFELYGILTSKGIQKRYVTVAKERTAPKINLDFWLLNDEESAGLVPCTQKSNYEGSKSNYEGSKSNYEPLKESKVKKSKVKYSKVEESNSASAAAFDECIKVYNQYIGLITPAIAEGIDFYISQGVEPKLINRIIEYSAEQNKRSWQYILAALNGNLKEGITTLESYERARADFISGKSKKGKKTVFSERCQNTEKTNYEKYQKELMADMLKED